MATKNFTEGASKVLPSRNVVPIRAGFPVLHLINDVARALSVSRKTIYRMVSRGDLTLVKIGPNSSRITDDSLQRLIGGSYHG